MVKPDKIILDKKTFIMTARVGNKLRWMISVNNVGSCGHNTSEDIVKAIDLRGICSAEAMKKLTDYFKCPVVKAAGEQLELF